MLNKLLQNIENTNPRKLFLYDGLGALLSAFLLGVVLVQFEWFFGIPKTSLYFLAFLPCLFAVYDFVHYRKMDNNISAPLKGIAIVNLLYCCLSLAIAFYHFDVITIYGWIYIVNEILIVVAIANIELKVAKRLKASS